MDLIWKLTFFAALTWYLSFSIKIMCPYWMFSLNVLTECCPKKHMPFSFLLFPQKQIQNSHQIYNFYHLHLSFRQGHLCFSNKSICFFIRDLSRKTIPYWIGNIFLLKSCGGDQESVKIILYSSFCTNMLAWSTH